MTHTRKVNRLLEAATRHHRARRYREAAAVYQQILALEPGHAEALHLLGLVEGEQGRYERAIELIGRAIGAQPGNALFHLNRGNAYWRLGQRQSAIADFHRAVGLAPHNPKLLARLAAAELQANHVQEAYQAYGALARLQKDDARLLSQLAGLALRLEKNEEASRHLERLLQLDDLKPTECVTYAQALMRCGNPALARKFIQRGLRMAPANLELLVSRVQLNQRYCYWARFEEDEAQLIAAIDEAIDGDRPIPVFNYLSLDLNAAKQHRIARAMARRLFAGFEARRIARPAAPARRGQRLRIGYVSGDFRNHPMSHLICNMFKHHDRERFEIYAYAIGPDDESGYREIIRRGVDHFIDLFAWEPTRAAEKIAADGIDILIDLAGYTESARPQLLALKPAPIQVSYLGLPGTMGTDFIDYLIADRCVIPESEQAHYSERVIYMPDCYFVTDDEQAIAPPPGKTAAGLPEDSFVWCCFNRTYKLTPAVFHVWLGLLQQVEDSILWLYCDSDQNKALIKNNLRARASAAGIDPARLIFATKLPKSEHLGRLRHADVFLDCFPVTAHTTAVDALWAGVPVISIHGDSMTSRVSASILKAAGLPELITNDLNEYHDLALTYARDRERLKQLKERIWTTRKEMALFDTARFCNALEKLFSSMWQQYCNSR